jgi:hypothetical protein
MKKDSQDKSPAPGQSGAKVNKYVPDTHKCRGSLKSLMGSITQNYSSTQGKQTTILERL